MRCAPRAPLMFFARRAKFFFTHSASYTTSYYRYCSCCTRWSDHRAASCTRNSNTSRLRITAACCGLWVVSCVLWNDISRVQFPRIPLYKMWECITWWYMYWPKCPAKKSTVIAFIHASSYIRHYHYPCTADSMLIRTFTHTEYSEYQVPISAKHRNPQSSPSFMLHAPFVTTTTQVQPILCWCVLSLIRSNRSIVPGTKSTN
jgi:hypothetical protein